MKRFMEKLERLARFQPNPEPEGPHYGDVLERAVAAGIDLWILYVLFHRLFQWIAYHLYQGVDDELLAQATASSNASTALHFYIASGALGLWLVNAFAQLLIIGLFIVGMQIAWQGTPGKRIMGLKILRRHTFEQVEPWRYVVRYLGYMVGGAPLMLGILWAHFNRERRGWHDIMAGTVVIQTRGRGWYWTQVKRGWRWLKNKLSSKEN